MIQSKQADLLASIDPSSPWVKPKYALNDPVINEVEIQLVSWCNRSCDFCPSGTFPVPKKMMEWGVIHKIIEELELINFQGTIGLHLICEPLLHRDFQKIVGEFRKRLPKSFIRIESNGDVLDNKFTKLADYMDAGLNEILINCYDSKEQREERNDKLLSLTESYPAIWYWNIRMRNPRMSRFRWKVVKLRDFFDDDYSLRNWAGHVEQQRSEEIQFPLPLSCARPFDRVHVNYKGEVILCNNDWKFEVVAGDLTQEPLQTAWNSPTFLEQYRPKLLKCDRSNKLCESCDSGLPWEKEPKISPASDTNFATGPLTRFARRFF